MGTSDDERVIGDVLIIYDYRSSNDSKYQSGSVGLGFCDRVSDLCVAEFFLFKYGGVLCVVFGGSFAFDSDVRSVLEGRSVCLESGWGGCGDLGMMRFYGVGWAGMIRCFA